MQVDDHENEIAVVGMSCRLPGARDPAEFWRNLCAGVESVSFFSHHQLREAGVSPDALGDPSFVGAHGAVPDAFAFDAPFFGVSQREALVIDPQQRVFLECAWSALEDAGVDPGRFAGAVGVFAGSGTSAWLARVLSRPDVVDTVGEEVAHFANGRDFLTTRVSYKLGLRGPSVVVQTACSTSLVAVHLACQSLLVRECDLALAGGVTILTDQVTGYRYQEGGILSPDGHCRAFDARAAGTVGASGAGVVALKRMVDALRDGDTIHAVVKGSAINNDGAAKIGFTAPGVEGQARVIAEAQMVAGADPSTITFVETHGTATPLGDPIEIAALTEVFGGAARPGSCALGAVKSNIGHADAAAGVAGLIKAVLALRHRTLPPTLHFRSPNPETGLEGSPFYVNTELRPWERGATPRRAGVSSFGIGGTNAHVVLEEAPEAEQTADDGAPRLLVLSARSEGALARMQEALARHLDDHPALSLDAAAQTLSEGRAAHPHRWAAAVRTVDDARAALAGTPGHAAWTRRAEGRSPVAFLFPGGGTQYPGMARELYQREPVFRAEVDACAAAVAGELGVDLRSLLFPAPGAEEEARRRLEEIRFALPALFAVEYGLARLWMHWGVVPDALLGHSMGEYVAACVAGVFTRDAAARLVAARARLMAGTPPGAMLAVPLPEDEVRPLLTPGLSLAVVNGAAHCVVSGAAAEISALEARLSADDVLARRLHVSVASHSAAMDPVLDAFEAEVRKARPAAPRIPFVSNVTGDWITDAEATDPAYWVRHLRQTVRFADGVRRLLETPGRALLEVGPGETLGTFARRDVAAAGRVVARSLAPPDAPEPADLTLLDALGALWTAGVEVEWAAVRGDRSRLRVPLPTYPFERTVYHIPHPRAVAQAAADFDDPPFPPVPAYPPAGPGSVPLPPALPALPAAPAPAALPGGGDPPFPPVPAYPPAGFAPVPDLSALPPLPAAPPFGMGASVVPATGWAPAPAAVLAPSDADPPYPPIPAYPADPSRFPQLIDLPVTIEPIQPPAGPSRTAGRVTELFARLLGQEPASLDPAATFLDLGADSLLLMQAGRTIEKTFGVRVPFRRLIDGLATIDDLAAHLDREAPPPPEPIPAPPAIPVAPPPLIGAPPTAQPPSIPTPPAPLPGTGVGAAPAASAVAPWSSVAPVAPAAPAPVATWDAAAAGPPQGVQEIVARQLAMLQTHAAIMQQQLDLLRGGSALPPAPWPPAASPAGGNGAHAEHPPLPAAPPAPLPSPRFDPSTPAAAGSTGSMGSTGSGASSAAAESRAATEPARSTSSAAPATPAVVADSPGSTASPPAATTASAAASNGAGGGAASHGPHRSIRQTMGQGGGHTERQARHFDELVRRYTARTRRSKEYAAGHRPMLADNRAALGFRMATKELLYPIVGERSEGSRLWDVDGNEYVDFTLGFGTHFFGHRPPFIVEAVEAQMRKGFHLGPQSDLAGPAARLVREVTGMERVAFCNTGSDAMMAAVRIARTATGRDRIALFEGSYHGCFDGVLARGAGMKDGEPRSRPVAPGTPQRMVDDVAVLPYGTPEALAWLRRNAGELAAVIVEPVQNRNPEFHPVEFLREVRELTRDAGTVLIFDEMVTGFRMGARGAQDFYGIDADMATYGKVVGGGFPMGIVAGEARLMDAIDGGMWNFGDDSFPAADQTFFAGTFCKHPVAMAAVCAVLRHIQERGPALYDELNDRAARLVAALRRVIAAEDAPIRILSCGSLFHFRVDPDVPWADLLFFHMVERGVYIWEGRACFLSTAHTDDDCERLVEALRGSLQALRDGGFLPDRPGPGGGGAPDPADGGPLAGPGEPAPDAPGVPADLKLFPGADAPSAEPLASFPLTPAQRQVWVHAQLGDDASRAYNEQMTMGLRGRLDRDALRAALGDVMLHHEALRTVFDPSGETQHVLASLPVALRVEDEAADGEALAQALDRAARETFDLRAGPLFRVHLHPRAGGGEVVQLVFHHVMMDGLGSEVLMRDLEAAYRERAASRVPALAPAMQLSEYAALLRAHAEAHAAQEAEWLARFEGAVPLALPTDRQRPRFPTNPAGRERITLDAPLAARLREVARREGCTLFNTLLAGLLATLHRVAAQDDLVIGIPSAGRPFPGSETLVAHCVDVLPLRSRVDGGTRLIPFLREVRGWLLDVFENEVFSHARLRESLDLPRGPAAVPLVSVGFNLEPGYGGGEEGEAGFAGVEAEAVGGRNLFTKFDLNLDAVEVGGEVELICLFNADLFERETVARLLGYLRRVLEQVAAGDARVHDVELMDAAGRERVLGAWNDTVREYSATPAHALFARQARHAPTAAALLHGGGALTYAELDRRAGAIARRLRALGVGPEVPVGLCMERTPELVAAVLGIWKAGGAYVPLDPAYPAERLGWIMDDAGLAVVLTAGGAASALPAHDATLVRVDDDAPDASADGDPRAASTDTPSAGTAASAHTDGGSDDDELADASPASLAYVIYTSGSTGRPKGVLVEHGSLANLLAATRDAFGVGPGDVMPALASYAFDIWLFETLLPLTSGAAVRLVAADLVPDPAALVGEVADATLLHAVPALMRPMARAERERPRLSRLRRAFVGGDRVPPELLEEMREGFPEAEAHVLYGPTEATILASALDVPADGPVEGHPIGRPLGNVRLYVCDAFARPRPPGVPGELLIGGAGVARGYLGRPARTAERFVPDPFAAEPGARLYRTGDRARWRGDGTLEFMGRVDRQLKLRGFRIEPGEVEAVLRRHEEVADCTVQLREDETGEPRLVAYVVGAAPAAALREHLRRSVPEHMVPAAFVALDRLPLSPNGKLDAKALPAPEAAAPGDEDYEPRTPAEEVLAGIWAQVLGRPRVGVRDDFFVLGGHSLLATRVVARVREVFGVELPLRTLFEHPTVAAVAERVEALRGAGDAILPPVTPVERGEAPLPLSFAQERLWFLDRMEPGSAFYNIPAALRLSGPLDAAALERALGEIVRRHEVLRTTFAEGPGGAPVQVVAPFAGFALAVHDLSALDPGPREAEARRLAAEDAAGPFDLAAGPLFRATLLRLGAADHALLLCMHHVASDGWSMGVFFRELAALYPAFRDGGESPLAPLPVQYADYAVWQREQLRGEVLDAQLAWWTERLAGAPALLELPADHPRPAVQRHQGGHEPVRLPRELAARLRALGRREGATLYMVLLGAFQALLGRYAASDDVVVGSPVAGRARRETEELIGFFVNTLVLRTDLSGDPSFAELLGRVREATLGAWEHQDVPFERLVAELAPERSLSHAPLFQVLFALQDEDDAAGGGVPGVEIRPFGGAVEIAKFDLALDLAEVPEGLEGGITYATALFEPATVRRMLRHFARLLEQAAADPSAPLSSLELLGEMERQQLLGAWSGTRRPVPESPVHHLIAEHARRAPGAVALLRGAEATTYAALDRRAEAVAKRLRALGVGPEVPVGLCAEPSEALLAGVLGIWKAGGAYVPLDPAYPAERLRWIVADAALPVIVTAGAAADALPEHQGAEVRLDDIAGEVVEPGVYAGEARAAADGVSPASLAYVIYTSGSTGRPKGVLVQHGSLASFLAATRDTFGPGPGDVMPALASYAFDIWFLEAILPLTAGAAVRLVARDRVPDAAALLDEVADATLLHAVPALMRPLAEAERERPRLSRLRYVFVGGDRTPGDLLTELRESFPRAETQVIYGPTETTIVVTRYPVPADGAVEGHPIGRPVAGARLYVCGAGGTVQPVGVPGELMIGGTAVARGYAGRPAMTAERFVPDPFGGEPGARMYRSGDRVRWTAEGTLQFMGRIDRQVKVRGFRIEPGEIEAVLRRHARVAECAVVAREDQPGDWRLAAYVVPGRRDGVETWPSIGPDAGEALPDALREHLRATLPEYMVPSAFVLLDRLPLSPNGKLDVKALPAPGPEAGAYEAPRTPLEAVLAATWAEVLNLERVGAHDNFFELGGHSLLATRVVSRLRDALGVELPVRALFETSTVAGLAAWVDAQRGDAAAPPVTAVERGGALPLSFGQERLWLLERVGQGGAAWNISVPLRLGGPLDAAALERALGEIVRRHEALRTTFAEGEGGPVQVIAPFAGFALEVADLSATDDPPAEARLRARHEAAQPFDLGAGPLFRAALLRLAPHDHVLVLTLHHVVGDGWSLGVLFGELSALYAAFRRGEGSPLPEPAVQYADYAVWQRERLRGGTLARELAWWRERMAGAPELLALPTDHPRPAVQGSRGASEAIQLSPELLDRLQALGRRESASLYMVLLGGFSLLLSRYADTGDVVVGTTIAGRTRQEVEGVIGLFMNTLALRTDLSGDPSFAEVLRRVRETTLGAYEHQELPFEKLVAELAPQRSLSHAPVFQVLFEVNDGAATGAPGLDGLTVRELAPEPGGAKYDLSVALEATPAGLVGTLTYSTDLFERRTARRMVEHLERILEAVAGAPDARVSEVELVGPAERRLVLEEWNRTEAAFPGRCIHQLFEAQADRTPDAVAVVCGGESLSYGELDARANRLARHLRGLGVGPEVRVGICLERSPELMVTILGVMKAGGAWVPMDPAHPAERIAFMVDDSGVAVLLTQARLRGRLPSSDGLHVVSVDEAWEGIEAEEAAPVESGVTPENLCYVIYTSGSTGRPKGVAMHHRGVVNYLHWGIRAYGADQGNGAPVFSSMAVDLTITNLLPLFAGRPVRLLPEEEPVEALAEALRGEPDFGVIKITPVHLSLLNTLLGPGEGAGAARTLVIGADFLMAEPTLPWQEHAPGVRLMNEYGPTETVVGCSAYVLPPGRHRAGPVPVGRAISNLRFYVLDAGMRPVPVGLPGELYIGGVGVARGYLGRPALSAEKFVPDPIAGGGARMYRTGDRARWRPDGNLLILGRTDSQVKVRGYRVELGEIEAVLRRHPAVDGVIVVAREDVPGEKRLVAYVVGPADADELRRHLRESLPEHMVPAAFVRLDALPHTPTGKIDPRSLPAPEYGVPGETRVAARTPAETVLAGIWAEVLGRDAVGVTDNFFSLGGDSILAMQVVSRARRAGLELRPRQAFEYQTVAELASVAGETAAAVASIADQAEDGPVPLTPVQARFFALEHPVPAHYNQSTLLAVDPAVSDDALEAALAAVAARHDALRLRFARDAEGWRQWHAPAAELALERVDLTEMDPDEQDRAQARISAERQAGLDLETGPVGRAVVFDRGARGRLLLLVLHHLVVDAVSWQVLVDELERACAGEAIDLGPRGTSFARWARALEAYAAGDALRAEAAHWLAQGADDVPPLPVDGAASATLGDARTVAVHLDAEETRALLHEAPAAYRTQINDLLLCALADAVESWTGSPRLRVALEGHGREEEVVAPGADLTRAVGWFTTVYPVVLSVEGPAGPGERLKQVKEQLRAVPGRGIGYGVLRHLSPDAALRARLAAHPEPEILFNYLGQAGPGTGAGAARLRAAAGPRGPEWAPENRRAHLLEINGAVEGGCLHLEWSYDPGAHRPETVQRLAGGYLHALRALIEHCRAVPPGGCTPSDFPLAGVTADELEAAVGDARGVEDLYPLSPMQEGMLFHALSGDGAQEYQVESAYRLEGELDEALFRRAWDEVAGRHAILRTAFVWEGVRRPLQRVERAVEIPWRVEDWRGMTEEDQAAALRRFLDDDRADGFDLRRAPLLRCSLFRVGDQARWFVWSMHHLLMDGWACARVLAEVFRLYEGWSTGTPVELKRVRPYRDYIAWLEGQDDAAAERYWRGALAGLAAPSPLGVGGPAGAATGRRAKYNVLLAGALTRRLDEVARGHQVTLNTLLLGAWGLLLSRYAGDPEVVLGTTVSGRQAPLDGVEEMIGLFINTLPVRIRAEGGERLGTWLAALQRAQAEAREHEYAPLAQVQRWSEVPRGAPLFETHFIFENYPMDRGSSAGAPAQLRVTDARGVEWNNYPLSLLVGPGSELLLSLSYDEGRFGEADIRAMLSHLEWLLEQVAAHPGARLSELTLAGPGERQRLVEAWNRTAAPFPADRCIHELFEVQAERTPDAVAVSFGGESLTYRELDARSNRLARHLRGLGIGPEVRVGICLERSLELLPCILGVMKAGGAWMPMDPAHPAERIAYLLHDSAVPVLLTQARLRGRLPAPEGLHVIPVDEAWEKIAMEDAAPVESGVTAENLCYVIYTSGSTGRPKGVAMHHRGVVNYIHWGIGAYGADQGSGAPVFSSMAVDLTITNLLPLFAGRPVRLLPEENPVEALAEALRERPGFGMIKITPTHLSLLTPLLSPDEAKAAARTLVIGADFLMAEPTVFWQDHAPGVRLMNEYGPTETVVGCSAHVLEPGAHRHGPVPVGGPIQNLRFYVLDSWLNPLPEGVAGELYIGGVGVARGYLGRPGLSAEKFVPDPFAEAGARMYRTGDRARWLEGGNLMILGRTDGQVKVRGYRVELGEIEAALRRHPAVDGAIVVAREDVPGDRRLVAYVVGPADAASLREHLRAALPEYMVPSAFVRLDTLPKTSTGKVDPRTLPAPEYAAPAESFVPPDTPAEEALAAIWAEVLGVERVGAADDFFELGGHSLLVMRLTARVQGAFGVHLPIRDVFAAPTLRAMAAEVERAVMAEILAMPEAAAEALAELNPVTGE